MRWGRVTTLAISIIRRVPMLSLTVRGDGGFWLDWSADTYVVTTINGDGKMVFFAGECTCSSSSTNVTYSWRTQRKTSREAKKWCSIMASSTGKMWRPSYEIMSIS